jgi:serine/threonine protein kinase
MSLQQYARIKKLGQGSFGAVYLVRDSRDGQCYVMKEVDLTTQSQKARKVSRDFEKLLRPNRVCTEPAALRAGGHEGDQLSEQDEPSQHHLVQGAPVRGAPATQTQALLGCVILQEFFEQEPQAGYGRKLLFIVMEYADGARRLTRFAVAVESQFEAHCFHQAAT